MLLPGVAAASEFTSAVAIHMPLCKNVFATCSDVHFTQATRLNPQNINCPMLSTKLLLHETVVNLIFRSALTGPCHQPEQ